MDTIPGIANMYFGLEVDAKAAREIHDGGTYASVSEWYKSKDRERTKSEQFYDAICNVDVSVTGIVAELLATNIYERIYFDVDPGEEGFTSTAISNASKPINFDKPYLERYRELKLHNYFNSFEDFMQLSRVEMSNMITTIRKMHSDADKDANAKQREALEDVLKNLQ